LERWRAGSKFLRAQVHPRHFVETARASGLGDTLIERAFARLHEAGAQAFDRVAGDLPPDFPDEVRETVLRNALRRYLAIASYDAGTGSPRAT
jgi:serine/threonine-protein kinase HipA